MRNLIKNDFTGNLVAVYWDFENIHASLLDLMLGESGYLNKRFTVQDPVINIKAIMGYVSGFGPVIINRAYANWQYLSRYRDSLNDAGADLIQLFPRGKNMKNSADIRLALDAFEDLYRYERITHFVIISGDSDFISLSLKIKQAGRFIIGIGVRESTNVFWVKSCNEFKFYESFMTKSDSAVASDASSDFPLINGGEELLLRALNQLIAQRGENRVSQARLKSLICQLNPAFSEADYGFKTFGAFVASFPDKINILDRENGGHVGLNQEFLENVTPISLRQNDSPPHLLEGKPLFLAG